MVGQEILVLFIMVRIRAPQPKIKTPMWRFYFWFVATVRSPQRTLPVRKQVGEISDSAVEPSRFPRGRPAPRELSAPQPPFASVTMRWQAVAEQFTRRGATRSFNEVWQTPMWRFYFWFVATVRSPQRTLPVRKQVGEISDSAVEPSRFPRGRPAPV